MEIAFQSFLDVMFRGRNISLTILSVGSSIFFYLSLFLTSRSLPLPPSLVLRTKIHLQIITLIFLTSFLLSFLATLYLFQSLLSLLKDHVL